MMKTKDAALLRKLLCTAFFLSTAIINTSLCENCSSGQVKIESQCVEWWIILLIVLGVVVAAFVVVGLVCCCCPCFVCSCVKDVLCCCCKK